MQASNSRLRMGPLAIALAMMVPIVCHAAPFMLGGGALVEVEYGVGSGDATSQFVVDFGNQGGPAFVFQYHYDGSTSPSAQSAWLEIVSGGALTWTVSDFGTPGEPNLFVDQFSYLTESETPDFGASGQSWAYWTGQFPAGAVDVAWSAAQVGMRDRLLEPGSWDGWRVTAYDPIDFSPVSPPQVPISMVPEPLGCGACGMMVLLMLRRQPWGVWGAE